ncbi:hypothetical protein [Myxococcus stipitatus]|uniref:hypothetical protein n=1 Tax=Myxococcus stipitatus TaxID=83455 RepID=UPI0030D5CBBF
MKQRMASRVAGLMGLLLALPAYAHGDMGGVVAMVGLIYAAPLVGSVLVFALLRRSSSVRIVLASLASVCTVLALCMGGGLFMLFRPSWDALGWFEMTALGLWGLGAVGLIGSWYGFATAVAPAHRPEMYVWSPKADASQDSPES